MARISANKILVFVLVALFLETPGLLADGVPQKHNRKRPAKQEQSTPAPGPLVQPTGPLTPLTLQQTPAIPAQVEYRNGELTITARNSTMGDILRSVRTQTGANMDYPSNATERVMGQFGPGPARDVLSALLSGSNFNFAIVGSPADPNIVEKVIITRNTGPAPPGTQPQVAGMQHPGFQAPNRPDFQSGDDSESSDDNNTQEEQNEPTDAANAQPTGDQQRQPTIKTPEQLLQELQRQQQMQQQQMQQQQGGMPQSFPTPPSDQSDAPLHRNRE